MYVRVFRTDAGADSAQVLDVDVLTALSVRLDGVQAESVDPALREQSLGEVRGDHAWLTIEGLRRAGPDDAQWHARFASMIRYAAGQSWLDDSGTRVRAHIEAAP